MFEGQATLCYGVAPVVCRFSRYSSHIQHMSNVDKMFRHWSQSGLTQVVPWSRSHLWFYGRVELWKFRSTPGSPQNVAPSVTVWAAASILSSFHTRPLLLDCSSTNPGHTPSKQLFKHHISYSTDHHSLRYSGDVRFDLHFSNLDISRQATHFFLQKL